MTTPIAEVRRRLESHSSPNASGGMTWTEWAEFTELAGQLDFGCRFDCDGCQGNKASCNSWTGETTGCCGHCSDAIGYLLQVDASRIDEMVSLWNEETGWARPDGCALPRELRSGLCTTYRCYEVQEETSPDEYKAWEAFRDYSHGRGNTIEELRAIVQDAGLIQLEPVC